jgi:hypothetical protein
VRVNFGWKCNIEKGGRQGISVKATSAGSKYISFMTLWAGLPDGFFSKQKSKFGQILEGLRWRNVDIVFGHLEYFTDIGDFYDHFVFIWYIFPVLVSCT